MGDSALAVDIIVALIKTLGLTELVSDALASRKQKEAETNAKIVDLFKEALDEIKNCRTEQQRVEFHIALACGSTTCVCFTATTVEKLIKNLEKS